MAHFRMTGDKFRAEVAMLGVRRSKTFTSESAAKIWAEKVEEGVRERHDRLDAARNATLSKLIPKRVLDAVIATAYTKHQIVNAAMPCGDHCGIYFLIHQDDIVYVGKSINIFNRIARHRADGRVFDSFAYLLCPEELLDSMEANYITAFMPWMNIALGKMGSQSRGKEESHA